MKKFLPYLLSALSAVFISVPWITPLPNLILLVAFVPLLYAEEINVTRNLRHQGIYTLFIAFICFFLINLMCLWWLQKLLSYWAILFLFYNSLLSSLFFLLFSFTKKKLGLWVGVASFVIYTTAFEYLYLNIDFSFPCMLVGSVFMGPSNNLFIQWYEYTGVLGGSVWVLLCNVLLYLIIKKYIEKKKPSLARWIVTSLVILIPLSVSLFIYHTYTEKEDPVEVVMVQPNIDPYKDKFIMSYNQQLDSMLVLAEKSIASNTEYVIFPETALDSNIWINNITENYMVLKIRDSLLSQYPQTKVITGVNMMEYYVSGNETPPTSSARKVNDNIYYDYFNAAIQVDSKGDVEAYKKSKLVLGTEYVPLSNKIKCFENISMQLGGSSQSRGTQPYPSLLKSKETNVATVICYESLFGEYVSEFVDLGADFICVITNDGWWNGTPGPRMHLRFSQLRAIETRRSVVRCANTGISAYINQKGEIVEESQWWTATSMNNTVNKNNKITFYTQHGDYIGRIAAWLSVLVLLAVGYKTLKKRKV